MGVNGEMDQYEINTNDTSFDRLHIPPKMFVDLNFTILNLTKYKHINLNGSTLIQPTSSLNEIWQ